MSLRTKPTSDPRHNLGRMQIAALSRACLFAIVVTTPLIAGIVARSVAFGWVP